MAAPSEDKNAGQAGEPLPSSSELFSSAKVVAGAAQAYFQGGGDKVEKAKVAGAASGLLGAASHYGKLEEKGYGEYVQKAETYLQQYGSTTAGGGATEEAAKPPAPAAATVSSAAPAGDEPKSGLGGGYGEYAKLAQGLLGGGGEGGDAAKSEGGGFGEGVMKMAGGFLK